MAYVVKRTSTNGSEEILDIVYSDAEARQLLLIYEKEAENSEQKHYWEEIEGTVEEVSEKLGFKKGE